MPLTEALSKEEESQFDAMKAADVAPSPAAESPPAPSPETPTAETSTASEDAKHVPVAEVIKQRERRQAAEKEVAAVKAEYARLQGRLDTLEQLAKQVGQPAAPALPDVNADPVGYFRAKTEAQEKQLSELATFRQQFEQRQQQQFTVQQVAQTVNAQEMAFRKDNPDYDEAVNYIREVRGRQLAALGITDPAMQAQHIQNDVFQIANAALQNKGNAAQVAYELAKASGWTPKAKATAPAPVADSAKTEPTPDELKVALAAKGQEQGASIGQVRGTAPKKIDLAALANMSNEEFAEATKGNKWKQFWQ